MQPGRCRLLLLVLLPPLALLSGLAVGGVQAVAVSGPYELLPDLEPRAASGFPMFGQEARALQVSSALTRRRLFGSDLPLIQAARPAPMRVRASGGSAPGGEGGSASPEAAASRQATLEHPLLVGIPPEEMELVSLNTTPHITYVHFRQTIAGHPVLGSRILFQWDREGRLALVDSEVCLEAMRARRPAVAWISAGQAEQSSRQGLPPEARVEDWEHEEAAWLAVVSGSDPWAGLRPVWNIRFRTEDPPGWWDALVDGESGALISRINRIVQETVSGRIEGEVEPLTVGDPPATVPFARQIVSVQSGGFQAADTADGDGRYQVSVPAAGRYRVTVEMRGAYAWVRNALLGLRTPLDTLSVEAPGQADFHWDGVRSETSERDAYIHVTQAHEFIRSLDSAPALAALDRSIQVRVDDPTGNCNAYWNGVLLAFYAEGAGCVSAARVADVVIHEYGHAVTQSCYRPFFPPDDMGEAFSDYFAATVTGQPNIGVGFYGPGTRIRDVERDRVWPSDANPSPHLQGLILAGALWDLRKALGPALADSLYHYARYGAAQSFDDYLIDLLTWDDEDGDLATGTPHFNQIIGAFRPHGIGDYSVRISHQGLPDFEDPGPAIEVTAQIRSLLGLAPDSVSFFYSPGGDYQRLVPAATGSPREFRVQIPSPPSGTGVRYYWAAADTAGHRATLPPGAPDSTFSFFVGPDLTAPAITHQPLELVAEDLQRLTLRVAVSDNSHRIGLVRALLRREDSGPETETSLNSAGNGLWRGELELGSLSPGGSFSYRLEAEDLAHVPNVAHLPAQESFHLGIRAGRTLPFDAEAGPLQPSGDWAWGTPSTGSAWSGSRVWATSLTGSYSDDRSSTLIWGPLDLRSWDRARLEFMHLYRTEARFDGGRVEIAEQAEGPWFPLPPEGDYPDANVSALEGAGYSGDSGGWQRVCFPLDLYLGREVWVQLHFASDAFLHDLGWMVDDVTLLAAQARASPLAFQVEECAGDCLDLHWQDPPGIDTLAARFLGYNLYRGEGAESTPDVLQNPIPLRSPAYSDSGLVSGTLYKYRLTAVYDEGESPGAEASGTPYDPALGLDLAQVEYSLQGVAVSDTTFLVTNLTGGHLEFDAFLGEETQSIEDLRILCPREGLSSSAYTTVWRDGIDAGENPDLAEIALRDRLDAGLGSVLEVRLRGHSPWGNPQTAWGGLLFIDSDANLATGRAEFNLGADFAVAFGKLAREAGADAPAVLLDSHLRPLASLPQADLPLGADSLSFKVPWRLLGDPRQIRVSLLLARGLAESPFDLAPERPDLPWLEREPRHGRATPGHPQPFSLDFDGSTVGSGTYHARLFLESNDRAQPVRMLPVTLTVSGVIPQEVQDLLFQPTPRGLVVSFRLPTDLGVAGASAERASTADLRWRRVTEEPAQADSSGRFTFLDTGLEAGRSYLYRFRVLLGTGTQLVYGPYPAEFLQPVPASLLLHAARPNPFRDRTELQADLPASGVVQLEIFDAAGRRIRTLLQGSQPAGTRFLIWDGRDEGGRAVPSGVYWARLRMAGGSDGIRVIRIR